MPDFDVVSLPDIDHAAEGDTAPDFTRPLVNDEYWEDASLSDLTDEGPVLLVFFTMDGAFPATYMWNEIRDRNWDEDRDLTVVGLSISDPYAHKQLVEERRMDYRLFSDPQNGVAEEYGIVHDLDGMAGVSEPRPAVFLLDEDRTVEYVWVAEEWPDFPDYDEVEAAIESQ
ncbi:redoxin domain-containing protein [Halorussus sp. MSC15.2]|uniref:redoxin domain-containing protein n=1 Tax=Halorussus sp. MSC15.2 TaxID=2283638 RepID=UPI0013D19559|nr:redoxin domain-containing protein [Halorussus sp. MSC15.2]NEU55226.1 redoxin domain-containing protein [Halorussus sp. MSC15.2]